MSSGDNVGTLAVSMEHQVLAFLLLFLYSKLHKDLSSAVCIMYIGLSFDPH